MSLNIIKQTGTANTTYSPGRPIKYIAIHYTAGVSSKQGAARGMASWCANPAAQGAADFAVDDVEFVQYNPDIQNRYCWAVGGGKYNTKGGRLYKVAENKNCISIEMCSNNSTGKITYPNDPHYSLTNATIKNAIKLTKYLMKQYNIDADHVIRHYDVNGKECPGIIGWNADSGDESKWKEFKKQIGSVSADDEDIKWYRVRLSWADAKSQLGAYQDLNKAKQECPAGYSVFDYQGNCVWTTPDTISQPAYSGSTEAKGFPKSKEDYIEKVGKICKELMAKNGILASVVAAQCCLETGFGLGSDSTELVKVNNLLGMKCDLINSTWKQYSTWNNKEIVKRTPEYYNGVLHYINDHFRVYDNYQQCIEDYEQFLLHVQNNKGYKYARIKGWTDPAKVIHAIRIGTGTDAHPEGYCTDANYETKILNLIKQYNLDRFNTNYTPSVEPEPAPTPTPSTDITSLKLGSKGDTVKTMQKMLVALGYDLGSYGADGDFGQKTDAAVRQFQKKYKLTVDGVYGQQTKTKLEEIYKQQQSRQTTGNKFQVCAGRFSIKKNANNLIKKLKTSGFDAVLVQEGKEWIVQCGMMEKLQNANNLCQKIKNKGFDCIVRQLQ